MPRNRFAAHAHGFLAQVSQSGSDVRADARKQLLAYPTVRIVKGDVTSAAQKEDDFVIELEAGPRWFTGRRLLQATGDTYRLSDVPGLAERWGSAVVHCPYCYGYG